MTKNNSCADMCGLITEYLFESYEIVYDIDVINSRYVVHYCDIPVHDALIQVDSENFFEALKSYVYKFVHCQDQKYLLQMLKKEKLLYELQKNKYYSVVFRLMINGKSVYYKIRATHREINGSKHIFLGIRNVDETIRQEHIHEEALAHMYQKQRNYLEAILVSAAGYLEVNLSKDIILEHSLYFLLGSNANKDIEEKHFGKYSNLNNWICNNSISKNVHKYRQISDRDHLIGCFANGERRASVSFSVKTSDGEEKICKEIFHIYYDKTSNDVMAFCVIYNFTEEQRREKELQDLEKELQMIRIKNFTSQMQPHFLYNALISIQEVILMDPQYASDLVGDFTTHLRSCIRAMESDKPIPFSQELNNIKAYLNIENMRFGDKLKVNFNIGPEKFSIIPLSIQPLVENAIRHGIYGRGPRGGNVIIRSRETENSWIIEVEDDGVGFDVNLYKDGLTNEKNDSTGLKNTIFRIEKIMHGYVDILSAVGIGTKITVSIPKGEV